MQKKGTTQEIEEAKWVHCQSPESYTEWLELVVHDKNGDRVVCCLELRPHYCDRGHLCLKVDGHFHLDESDSFPRYFFDFEEADLHVRRFLNWRIHEQRECIHWLYPPNSEKVIKGKSVYERTGR